MLTSEESDDVGTMRGDNDDMSGLNGTVGIAFVALFLCHQTLLGSTLLKVKVFLKIEIWSKENLITLYC